VFYLRSFDCKFGHFSLYWEGQNDEIFKNGPSFQIRHPKIGGGGGGGGGGVCSPTPSVGPKIKVRLNEKFKPRGISEMRPQIVAKNAKKTDKNINKKRGDGSGWGTSKIFFCLKRSAYQTQMDIPFVSNN
jgi:hypothetical protein